jgi:glycosyltransferase involved in cell wall biosynthesis
MSFPLAIFAPRIGAVTETFIRRHIDDLLPGGTVAFSRGLVSKNSGWNVNVPLLELERLQPRLTQRGIDAVTRKLGRSRGDHSVAAVKHFLKQHGVEVVMGEYLDASLGWLEPVRQLGLRFFAHAHGYDVSSRLRDPTWRTAYVNYNDADGVITMSEFSKNRLIGLGLQPSKIHLIPYGVDVPREPSKRSEQETIRCLMVGRMVDKKAPLIALEAFRRAVETNDRLRLDFVGTGPLLLAVEQFIQCFNLERRVILRDAKPNEEVLGLMREADIFIQHSITDPSNGDEEGLPVAILEAMAHGLPVVSTRHAGIPEAVEEEVTGYLVNEGDYVGMAQHIIELARDRELRRALGVVGWKRAKERFSWEREQKQLCEVLGVGNYPKRLVQASLLHSGGKQCL